MTNKLTRYSSSRQLLHRILEQPGLICIIQQLEAPVLAKLVEHVGLEDSGEIISLATVEQIKALFDLDLWRNDQPGKEERFDPDRFAVWLQILFEMGSDFAVEKIAELDEDFLVMALSQHVFVINIDELAMRMSSGLKRPTIADEMLEKALESGLNQEFEEFRVISKNHRSWDAVLTLLVELDKDHHDLLTALLERCHSISTEYIEDSGGLYEVLTADEQIEVDVAYEREQRREKEGYVSPATAASFLSLIRISEFEELLAASAYDTVTASYFKNFAVKSVASSRARLVGDTEPGSEMRDGVAAFVGLLKSAGVLSEPQQTLLLQGSRDKDGSEKYPLIRRSLRAIRDSDAKLHLTCMSELNYLANVLASGCHYSDRGLRPGEAAEAALATCNLGMEQFVFGSKPADREADPALLAELIVRHNLVRMFQVGWSILFREVSLHTAKFLLAVLPGLSASAEVWEREQVDGVVRALNVSVSKGTPWNAREQLDILEVLLEQTTVQALKQFLDESPTVPADLARQSGESDGFIFTRRQIAAIHRFLDSVPSSFK